MKKKEILINITCLFCFLLILIFFIPLGILAFTTKRIDKLRLTEEEYCKAYYWKSGF